MQIPCIFHRLVTATKTRNIQTYFDILFQLGCVLRPIEFYDGDYPPLIKEWTAKKSKKEGYSKSRLPSFTKKEVGMVQLKATVANKINLLAKSKS